MRIEPLFTEAEIEARIRELSARIYRDYADSPLVILCIADGALRFVDALLAKLEPRGLSPERMTVRARTQRPGTRQTSASASVISTFSCAGRLVRSSPSSR